MEGLTFSSSVIATGGQQWARYGLAWMTLEESRTNFGKFPADLGEYCPRLPPRFESVGVQLKMPITPSKEIQRRRTLRNRRGQKLAHRGKWGLLGFCIQEDQTHQNKISHQLNSSLPHEQAHSQTQGGGFKLDQAQQSRTSPFAPLLVMSVDKPVRTSDQGIVSRRCSHISQRNLKNPQLTRGLIRLVQR